MKKTYYVLKSLSLVIKDFLLLISHGTYIIYMFTSNFQVPVILHIKIIIRSRLENAYGIWLEYCK